MLQFDPGSSSSDFSSSPSSRSSELDEDEEDELEESLDEDFFFFFLSFLDFSVGLSLDPAFLFPPEYMTCKPGSRIINESPGIPHLD